MPSEIEQLLQEGLAHHKAARLAEANKLYRQLLAKQPNHADALHLLGVLAGQCNRPDVAVDLIGRAISVNSRPSSFHLHMAESFLKLDRDEEALASFRTAAQRNPDPDDCRDIAVGLRSLDALPDAEAVCRRGLAQRPQDYAMTLELAQILEQRGNSGPAATAYQQAAALNPFSSEPLRRLGLLLQKIGQVQDAVGIFRRLRTLEGFSPESHYYLGNALVALGAMNEGIAELQSAISIKPDYVDALASLAHAFWQSGDPEESLNTSRQAIKLKPDCAQAHVARAFALLQSGDMARGWKELDWRRLADGYGFPTRHVHRLPWNGFNLLNRTLLVHAEQSIADTLQFVRFIPYATRGGTVILECPRALHELLRGVRGVHDVCDPEDPVLPVELQAPLLTLPLLRMTTMETVPAKVPYITPDAVKMEAWRQRLGSSTGRPRIGLAWAVDAKIPADRRHNCPLPLLIQTLAGVNADFISLQMGAAAAEARQALAGFKLLDTSKELRSFAELAALIATLDAVVTVDSPVAHIAGALARPTHLLLSSAADWRWMLDRKDSPWYPTMRLYRQGKMNDWSNPLSEVAAALMRQVKTNPATPKDETTARSS